ncbi:MAG: OsmC family protein [Bacteroidota bacterium]|jgi:uncharacterized OsmC-like protein
MKTSLKTIAALVLSGMITQSALANTGGDSTQVNQSNQTSKTNTMTTVTKTVRINGFDLNDIVSTVEAIQTDPSIARFEFRAHNKWIQGGHNRSTIQGFYGGGQEDLSRKKPFVLDNSEPPILLGNNEGANPVEYILHGLAGCMTTTMVLHAAANNIQLESVESWLEGDLDVQGFLGLNDKVRNGYQQIRVTFTIKGDLKEEEKQKLESFVRMSPVYDIVTNKVPVVVKLQY